jgi:hypothetical protein
MVCAPPGATCSSTYRPSRFGITLTSAYMRNCSSANCCCVGALRHRGTRPIGAQIAADPHDVLHHLPQPHRRAGRQRARRHGVFGEYQTEGVAQAAAGRIDMAGDAFVALLHGQIRFRDCDARAAPIPMQASA